MKYLIRIERNYDYPDFFRQTPNNDGKWGQVQITYDSLSECDMIIVFNQYPENQFNVKVRKGGRILIVQEPAYYKNRYYVEKSWEYDKVISHFNPKNNIRIPAMLPWMVDRDYTYLKSFDINSIERSENVVWITSTGNQNPGHQPRLDFLGKLQSLKEGFSLFGRGINPINDKFDELVKTKYSIAIENYSNSDYFTEKVIDSFLSGSFPFYYGCTNLEDYFPKNSFQYIDIHDHERSLALIEETIKNKSWEKNVKYINEARRLILDEYQFFPAINKLLDDEQIKLGSKRRFSFSKKMTIKEKIFMKLNIYENDY